MRLGVCTTDFQRANCADMFSQIADYGFERVQLSFASLTEGGFEATDHIEIPERVSPENLREIARQAEKRGLTIAAANGTYNMAHPDAEVRAEGARRFPGFAEAASALGAQVISLCTGTRSRETLWTYCPDTARDGAWRDMRECLLRALDAAERFDLTLAVETEASNVIDTPEKARRLMDDIGSARLKICMDCANLFHAGQARRALSGSVIEHAFSLLGKDVVIAHGKDIQEGDGLRFCPTGEGIVDFPRFFSLLAENGYDGDMMLHGVYRADAMRRAVSFARPLIEAYRPLP